MPVPTPYGKFKAAQREELREFIVSYLDFVGTIDGAANAMGMQRRTLQRLMDEFGMDRPRANRSALSNSATRSLYQKKAASITTIEPPWGQAQ